MEKGAGHKPLRVVITGVCGSGKTVLAEGLKTMGYDARAVAQEHSLVPELFLHSRPDLVIYLEASDATVAGRKQTGWEPHQLAEERRRLKLARERADIHLNTDGLEPSVLLERAGEALAGRF
ncbi:MAG: DEAD/DEAH box helicase family protein [Thermoleophilia bacterium]